MNCGKCKNEVEADLDDEGMDYVDPCQDCLRVSYENGLVDGYLKGIEVNENNES